jgi:formyl-CoA transferase
MRVLDVTQFEAGPACTQALAWLGADVVKVEMPGRGDRARGVDRSRNEAYALLFCAWNANKRSVAIDLRNESGHALFLRLAAKFDVLVENFGPGVMERLDVDYETLRAVNPGLIYARIKGFGSRGPHAGFAVQQPIAQAAAGGFSINGDPHGPPMMPGSMGDAGAQPGQCLRARRAGFELRQVEDPQAVQCRQVAPSACRLDRLRRRIDGRPWPRRPWRRCGHAPRWP